MLALLAVVESKGGSLFQRGTKKLMDRAPPTSCTTPIHEDCVRCIYTADESEPMRKDEPAHAHFIVANNHRLYTRSLAAYN